MKDYNTIFVKDLVFHNELYHHGVLGMKWGVRRYQPYSSVPRKSGKSGKEVGAAATKTINKGGGARTTGEARNFPATWSNPNDARIIESERRSFPDGRIIYPPVAQVIKDFENEKGTNPYPGPTGFDGLYDRVNPDYGENGTKNNCTFVGATMEIASRGYDVCARRSLGGAGAGKFTEWFDGAQNELCQSFDEMKQDILKDGNGSSGVLQGFYDDSLGTQNGGHTLHWRNENGNIIVADGQNHTEHSWDNFVNDYGFNTSKCIRTRLDNCEPNWDNLARDGVIGVNNAGRSWKVWDGGGPRGYSIYDEF